MRNICLQLKVLDGSLFQYNMALFGPGWNDDNRNTTFVRQVTPAKAAPGVTWQDIVSEYYSKRHGDELMSTVSFIEHIYLVVVSVRGISRMAFGDNPERPYNAHMWTPEESIIHQAKSLVMTRDYEAAGGYFANPKLKQKDFWPKD